MIRNDSKATIFIFLVCLTIATEVLGSPAFAARSNTDSVSTENDWSFFLSAYGWLAGIEGTIAEGGMEQEVNIPFTDLAALSDSGFMLDAEIRWRKWFVNFDGTWATLGAEEDGVFADLNISVDQIIYDISIGREIYSRGLDEKPETIDTDWQRRMRLDLFAGARYFSTEPTIDITSITGTRNQLTSQEERWDPVIGLRFTSALSKRWLILLSGDVGGFGIGSAANFTWQLEGNIGFRISRWFSLFAGYRALSFDLMEGDGAQRSGADLLQHGPLVGAGINF